MYAFSTMGTNWPSFIYWEKASFIAVVLSDSLWWWTASHVVKGHCWSAHRCRHQPRAQERTCWRQEGHQNGGDRGVISGRLREDSCPTNWCKVRGAGPRSQSEGQSSWLTVNRIWRGGCWEEAEQKCGVSVFWHEDFIEGRTDWSHNVMSA